MMNMNYLISIEMISLINIITKGEYVMAWTIVKSILIMLAVFWAPQLIGLIIPGTIGEGIYTAVIVGVATVIIVYHIDKLRTK